MPFNRLLYQYALLLSGATFILVCAGGLVTSTESGLAVPDWPLSFGQFFPPMVGGVLYEHSHRLIAFAVGLFTLGLTVLAWCFSNRTDIKILSLIALAAVCLQALLGGITVLTQLPTPVSVMHACLGQTFFCLVCGIALLLSRTWCEGVVANLGADEIHHLRKILVYLCTFIFIQLILGAWVRHTQGQLFVLHVLGAIAVLCSGGMAIIVILSSFREVRSLLSLASGLMGLLILQICLGAGTFFYTLMKTSQSGITPEEVLWTTAHQAAGALILMVSVLMALIAYRITVKPEETGPLLSSEETLVKDYV